ncbi:hypothetical protein [Novosphingobium colocasiae]|uniref:hypothetical protein n=1 Tax=Novosphingobium colocasiae TaxID=1256513 RepID=UPI0035B3AEC4
MQNSILWLENHDKLAGWAQFLGAMLALVATYFTVFIPIWHRKRQLNNAAKRLSLHGFEVIESYYRTSAFFLPFPISLKGAARSFGAVIDEINRFPVFELDDQGERSTARHLFALVAVLDLTRMALENFADDLDGKQASEDDRDFIRGFIGQQLEFVRKMLAGEELKRPEWPVEIPTKTS